MDTATGQVIGMLKTVLQATIDQLKRNWEAFRTNYGEAQTVLDYANRLLEALTPYANNTNVSSEFFHYLYVSDS